jgi:hypothetical protein
MSLTLLMAVLAAYPKPVEGIQVPGYCVVSPDAKVVFAPAKDGGLEALDVATGKILWTNKDAYRPAGASYKLVLAWLPDEKKRNAFRVVAIDAVTGKTMAKSDSITMPDWATTDNLSGHLFRTTAWVVEEGKISVLWHAREMYFGGPKPTREQEKAEFKETYALVSVDMKTGKVTTEERKPKAEEFGPFQYVVGEYQFREVAEIKGDVMMVAVTLYIYKDKKEVWKREIGGYPCEQKPE